MHSTEKNGCKDSEIQCVFETFENAKIPRVWIRGQWLWPARQCGRVVTPADDGHRFVRNVTEGEGKEGVDWVQLNPQESAAVSSMFSLGRNSPQRNDSEKSEGPGLILFTESGFYLALISSRSELGKRMRLWLAREVLPSIRATGSYSTAQQPAQDSRMAMDLARALSMLEILMAERSVNGMIGKQKGGRVRFQLKSVAACYYHPTKNRSAWMRKRGQMEQSLRRAVDFTGRWYKLPADREAHLWMRLQEMLDEALREGDSGLIRECYKSKQLHLSIVE